MTTPTYLSHRRHPRGDRSFCGIRTLPAERLKDHREAVECKVCRRSYEPLVPKSWAYRKKKAPVRDQGQEVQELL